MQLTEIKLLFSAYAATSINALRAIFIDNPNAQFHILLALLTLLLLTILIRTRRLRKQLNDIDKRDTIMLLTIQHYCAAINRAINEVLESNKAIATENAATHADVLKHIRLAHSRVKDVYTGIFKHLDLKHLRRAPKFSTAEQSEQHKRDIEEHNAILRETIGEMLKTEIPH